MELRPAHVFGESGRGYCDVRRGLRITSWSATTAQGHMAMTCYRFLSKGMCQFIFFELAATSSTVYSEVCELICLENARILVTAHMRSASVK